ncbi:MAG TPA: VOC family protein [Solirubrobacteraceae bacterium]|nr:VOC family protein [Solirubrobacteraceae bacterium]
MELQGLHHITMITGHAQRTVDFYADALGLRLVKQTVNFDAPEAYHLYFGDETGTPGTILTWFEFVGATPGRAGAGMIHRIELAVPSTASLDFWAERLTHHGRPVTQDARALRFTDPDGLAFELVPAPSGQPELRAAHPEVPSEHAIVGIAGTRTFGDPAHSDAILTRTLGFTAEATGAYVLAGAGGLRDVRYQLDPAPPEPGRLGAGTVHHIAWASRDEDHLAWQDRARTSGAHVTEVRDRDYFRSVYFREPGGVLFEIATISPGFAVDEEPEHLGESLRLPRMHQHLRAQLEQTLTPLINPRTR